VVPHFTVLHFPSTQLISALFDGDIFSVLNTAQYSSTDGPPYSQLEHLFCNVMTTWLSSGNRTFGCLVSYRRQTGADPGCALPIKGGECGESVPLPSIFYYFYFWVSYSLALLSISFCTSSVTSMCRHRTYVTLAQSDLSFPIQSQLLNLIHQIEGLLLKVQKKSNKYLFIAYLLFYIILNIFCE